MQKRPLIRARDLEPLDISRTVLQRLVAEGKVERVGRGLYARLDADLDAAHTLAQAQLRVPNGIICLLSALRFYDLTTQNPFEVWIAIDRKATKPKVEYPPLHVVRFSGQALKKEVEKYDIDGVSVKITSPARTVADCFKYRNKIGLDVALEALRDYRRGKVGSIDDLWNAAKLDRVTKVMRPYLEAMKL